MYTTLNVKTPPAREPVELQTVKRHLRVDNEYDDDLISDYIRAARFIIEGDVSRALITQTLTLTISNEPLGARSILIPSVQINSGLLEVYYSPVQSVTGVSFIDSAGGVQAFTDFSVDINMEPSRLRLNTFPGFNEQIQMEFVAGYGDDGSFVPPDLKMAIMVLTAHLYEHRGDANVPEPEYVSDLVADYRVPVW